MPNASRTPNTVVTRTPLRCLGLKSAATLGRSVDTRRIPFCGRTRRREEGVNETRKVWDLDVKARKDMIFSQEKPSDHAMSQIRPAPGKRVGQVFTGVWR
jgi:hypothetical protein